MDNQKQVSSNGEIEFDQWVARTSPSSSRQTDGTAQHLNAPTRLSTDLDHDVATTTKTTAAIAGSRSSSSSSSLNLPGVTAAANTVGTTSSDSNNTLAGGCGNVIIGAQSALGTGFSPQSNETKRDSSTSVHHNEVGYENETGDKITTRTTKVGAVHSTGTLRGLGKNRNEALAARRTRTHQLLSKQRTNAQTAIQSAGTKKGISSMDEESVSHRRRVIEATIFNNYLELDNHSNIEFTHYEKSSSEKASMGGRMTLTSESVGEQSRASARKQLPRNPNPNGSSIFAGNTRKKNDFDKLEKSIPNQGRIVSNHDLIIENGDTEVQEVDPEELQKKETDKPNRLNLGISKKSLFNISFFNKSNLAVARPVEDDISVLMEAEELDPEVLQKQKTDETKRKKFRMIGCFITLICSVVLGVSVGLSVANKETSAANSQPTIAPSFAPSQPLPPMENLELLYDELQEKTKESLYNNDSAQYQAWEWLLNHPNITAYPEWRKKQIFAMATFFISFEGPNWPEGTPGKNRWMNASMSECSWVLSNAEVAFFAKQSADIFGDAYGLEDYRPCNGHGQLQTLFVHSLSSTVELVMPPEIGLLTSLRILVILNSQVIGKLLDIIVPEMIELPNLLLLGLHGAGIGGTIPTWIGTMKRLKTLALGGNDLSGSIPTEVGEMTSLEFFTVSQSKELTGKLPSQLGLVTSLTSLYTYGSSLTGQIPTELGLLTNTVLLQLWNNALAGSIPSELGLMTNIVDLRLGNADQGSAYNDFTGTLPNELWKLSHLEELFLSNLPNLHGRLPSDIMMPNLTMLSISGSPRLYGTIPELLCSVQELNMDCSALLCGCYCPCISSNDINQTNP